MQNRRLRAALFALTAALSLSSAAASQPSSLPCAAWQQADSHSADVCLRGAALSVEPQTDADRAMAASNLDIDRAMLALTDDVSVLPPPAAAPTLKATVRQSPPVAVVSKVKNQPKPSQVAYKTPPVKAPLSRSQIVKRELQREQAALRSAENRLLAARKSGQNAQQLERQVADRRASISAMQTELSRL